jgi:hypothetical protein
MAAAIPTNLDELSEDWLVSCLSGNISGFNIASAQRTRAIIGTKAKVFFELTGQDINGDPHVERICVKGAFDEQARKYFDVDALVRTEAAFYRDVAPSLSLVLPRCLFSDENGSEGIVILEDLNARGVRFCSAGDTWDAEQVQKILSQLARLHAATWGEKPGRLQWLTIGSQSIRSTVPSMLGPARFDALMRRPVVQPYLRYPSGNQAIVVEAMTKLWRQDDASGNWVLGHGDIHLGQTYIEPNGEVGILDWESVAMVPWSKDVAYVIGSSLSVSDRRVHERDLLEIYLNELERLGAPNVDRDSAWEQYRAQMLAGIVWVVVTEEMQSNHAIATQCERFLTAISDLDTFAVLGF